MRRRATLRVVAVLCGLTAAGASAEELRFTGSIHEVLEFGPLPEGREEIDATFPAGQAFSGHVVYDPTVPETPDSRPSVGLYEGAVQSFSVDFGTYSIECSGGEGGSIAVSIPTDPSHPCGAVSVNNVARNCTGAALDGLAPLWPMLVFYYQGPFADTSLPPLRPSDCPGAGVTFGLSFSDSELTPRIFVTSVDVSLGGSAGSLPGSFWTGSAELKAKLPGVGARNVPTELELEFGPNGSLGDGEFVMRLGNGPSAELLGTYELGKKGSPVLVLSPSSLAAGVIEIIEVLCGTSTAGVCASPGSLDVSVDPRKAKLKAKKKGEPGEAQLQLTGKLGASIVLAPGAKPAKASISFKSVAAD